MSYTTTVYGKGHIWNAVSEPTDVDLTQIVILGAPSTGKLAGYLMEGSDRFDVVIEGTFDLSNNPQTAADLKGSNVTRIEVKLNGAPDEEITCDTGLDLVQWLSSIGYRYTLLGGDDVFFGSTGSPMYADVVRGGAGNDHFTGYENGLDADGKTRFDSFFGEDGRDTAHYLGKRADYLIDTHADIWDQRHGIMTKGISVVDSIANRDGTDNLKEVERLEFSDTMVGLDVGAGQNTGQVYRLYLTVLGRNPQADAVGCGFWIDKLDDGALTAKQMVGSFLNSTEFTTRFGSIASSNESFVNLMYMNLLGRDGHPDSGFNFWLNVLDNKFATREEVVVGFMDSPENVANAAPLIGDAPTFAQWVS